uniref:Uncharacterized protein n=1 Tax=Eutreptiella gymnastica TaxID=73025 RepID=A0A7S4C9L8_9EUGL
MSYICCPSQLHTQCPQLCHSVTNRGSLSSASITLVFPKQPPYLNNIRHRFRHLPSLRVDWTQENGRETVGEEGPSNGTGSESVADLRIAVHHHLALGMVGHWK